MKTNVIGICIGFLILMGCAKSGDSKPPAPAAADNTVVPPGQVSQMPSCSAIVRCQQQCASNFPYLSEQDIRDDYNSRGMLNSGAYTAAISQNRAQVVKFNACLVLPVNQVIVYP